MTSIMEFKYGLLTGRSHGILILVHLNSSDEGFKSASHLPEALLDPEIGHAYEPNNTAFNRAHNTKEAFWSWLEHPDNRSHLVRFEVAMNGMRNLFPANTILEGLFMLCSIYCVPPSYLQNIKFCRVRLGTPSPGFACCRCWRRRWRAVLYAR
jgi:hypothetical protein